MSADLIKQINWLDIFVVIIVLRISYIAMQNGFAIELFKVLGMLVALYFSLHYYAVFSDFIGTHLGIKFIPWVVLNFLSFIILAIFGYLIFVILRKIFARFIKLEPVPGLNKWGGFILGLGRALLLTSLVIYIFVISHVGYLKHSVKNAYSAKQLLEIAPGAYRILWDGVMSKFMTTEKFNQLVVEVQEELKEAKK